MKIQVPLLLLISLMLCSCGGKPSDTESTNQEDPITSEKSDTSVSPKRGYIEDIYTNTYPSSYIRVATRDNNFKNGPSISYRLYKNIPYVNNVSFYKRNRLSGSFCMFSGENLVSTINNIHRVNLFKKTAAKLYYPKDIVYEGYCINLKKNGKVEREGWLIFTEESIEAQPIEVGTWKEYKADGQVITEVYTEKDGDIPPGYGIDIEDYK